MLNDFISVKSNRAFIDKFDESLFDLVGSKISKLMTLEADDSEEAIKNKRMIINQTQISQPAILLQSILNYKKFDISEFHIENLFGPSLGEIISLVIADSIDYKQGARLLFKRGALMQESCAVGQGAMLNIIGDSQIIIEHVNKFKNNLSIELKDFIDISSINSKRLVVASGKTELIEQLMTYLKENAIACKKMTVSAAFHSKLMENAQTKFYEYLNSSDIIFKKPKFNILSTIEDLNVYQNIQKLLDENKFDMEVKKLLVKQLRVAVNLLDCVKYNMENHIEVYDMNKRKFIDYNDYI
jgi:[acyl-carrier-protein] S-malonyltransferase